MEMRLLNRSSRIPASQARRGAVAIRLARAACHGRGRTVRILFIGFVVSLGSIALAQPAPPVTPAEVGSDAVQNATTATGDATPASTPDTAETVQSPLVPAPLSAEIPEFHLTQVSLDADVATDRVNVVVTVEIMVNRGTAWHRVPLRLESMHVWKREYVGPGEELPDVSPRPSEEGLTWLIKGLGKHQLKLYGWLPLKRTTSGGQFQLKLPTLPPQFEARLAVRIPEPDVVVRASKNMTMLDAPQRRENEVVFNASVTGNSLLFAWQTPAVGGETVALVQSSIHLKPSTEHLSLVVEQSIELQQSNLTELLISLPSEFRVVQVSGPQYRSHELLEDRPNWVRVNFQNDGLGRLDLTWVLEREQRAPARTLQLEGFHVEGAIREEGLIRIDEFENFHMVPRRADSRLVHRLGVNQVQNLGSGTPLTAYEYLKQPFRLTFDLQPTVPHFTVMPVHQLNVQDDILDLTVTCPVKFDRGAISELKLKWPNWLEKGWHVVSVGTDSDATGPIAYDATSQPGVIRLWWPNPIHQSTTLTARFHRPLNDVVQKQWEFDLPVPEASEPAVAALNVTSADHLEVNLSAADGASLPLWNEVDPLPVLGGRSRGTTYRLESPGNPLTADISVHQREVSTQTRIEVQEATADDLGVEQIIEFDVRYGRMREVELVLPDELLKRIPEYAVSEAVEVQLDGTSLPLYASGRALRAELPEERKGEFAVRVTYRFPVEADQAIQDLDLPVIAVKDHPYDQAECLVRVMDIVQVRSAETGWEPLRTAPSQALWINPLKEKSLAYVPLRIGRKLADSAQQYVVEHVRIRTVFAADGSADTWAEFVLNSPQNRLVIQFPAKTEFKEFRVDGTVLPKSAISQRSGEFEEVTLSLPDQISAQPTVAVRYRTVLSGNFGLTHLVTMPLPQFSRSVWVDETNWEMRLPQGHHLFTYPNLVPQFQWVRHFLFWSRQPTEAYLAERAAQGGDEVPREFRFASNDFYAFRGFGPVTQISFRSMNRSLILLIGAGFTLLLGFVFWKIPATRNVFSLVVMSFLFAAASLWFVEPMLLLLQPAILGVGLALAATIIDSASRRRSDEHPSRMRLDRPWAADFPEDPSARSKPTQIYRPVAAGNSDREES